MSNRKSEAKYHGRLHTLYPARHEINVESLESYALNYLTHKLLIATDEFLYLYNTDPHERELTLNYKEKYESVYQIPIKVSDVESLIFMNRWVAVFNQSYFVFFNEKLESTEMIETGVGRIIGMRVFQRKWSIAAITGDFQMIRF